METATASYRWMITKDLPAVLSIESDVFAHPWTESEFREHLRQRNVIGMVAELDDEVVGYMVYALTKTTIHLLNFAVDWRYHRQGIGREMVNKLIAKLSYQRRTRVIADVSDCNLDAQLFFRACGFRAVSVLMEHYTETGGDAYRFVFRKRKE